MTAFLFQTQKQLVICIFFLVRLKESEAHLSIELPSVLLLPMLFQSFILNAYHGPRMQILRPLTADSNSSSHADRPNAEDELKLLLYTTPEN